MLHAGQCVMLHETPYDMVHSHSHIYDADLDANKKKPFTIPVQSSCGKIGRGDSYVFFYSSCKN